MELPRSLAPWSRYLGIFPRETSLAIGPLIRRISLAIGPMKSHSLSAAGDPDGFDDLARRGSYERLVTSEWLLADEAPDEFTRRAAMGEHLFLRMARREPTGSRVSLALFDAGPNQIGSPRIAHLAALIVLARRAEAAKSNFGWAILQKPEMPALTEVSESSILMLMTARDAREVTDADVSAWRSRCDSWKDLDDLWLVGGARISALPSAKGLPVLIVRDLIEPDVRQLSVVARHVSREPKGVVLDLPADRDSARLIRDPFSVSSAPPSTVRGAFAPQSNLLFDASGAKLFALSSHNRVISFPIPNSPRAGAGGPSLLRATQNRRVAAVGRIGRSTALLTRAEGLVSIEYVGRGSSRYNDKDYRSVHREIDYQAGEDSGGRLHPVFRIPGLPLEFVALDDHRSLFRMGEIKRRNAANPNGDPKLWLAASKVLALAPTSFGVAFVGKGVPGQKWGIGFIETGNVTMKELPFGGAPRAAHFGYGGTLAHQMYGFAAVQHHGSGEWLVVSQTENLRFGTVDSVTIVGTVLNPIQNERCLVGLRSDNRTLVLVNKDRQERVVVTASADIVNVTVSTGASSIAYSTENGEVVAYSLAHKADLCRFQPGEPS